MMPGDVLQRLYERTGYPPRGAGADKIARCPNPGHGQGRGDRNPSMSVRLMPDKVLIHCHVCGDGALGQILGALGLTEADLFAEAPNTSSREPQPDLWMPCHHSKVAEYQYTDEHGNLLYAVARCSAKCFRQWRPDPSRRGGRRWSLKDEAGNLAVPLVPYQLPQLRAALADGPKPVIWIAEGEKDVLALAEHGLTATCNSGGAGKWTESHAAYLAHADVIVVADRDRPGREHAEHVVATLLPLARSIEVVQAANGKDASDHFAAGGHIGDFVSVWEPKAYTTTAEAS